MSKPQITGVVLAGGLGRRMGGTDKGLQELRGQPMVHWVIERLAPQVDELLINANQNGERYAAFGHRVVPDQIPGFAGPLAACMRRSPPQRIRWWRRRPAIRPSCRPT